MELRWPDDELLESYLAALRRGWQPSSTDPASREKQIGEIDADPQAFVRQRVDPEGTLPPVENPDGTVNPRIPGYQKWMWDGEFCGVIGFRWARDGTEALPPYVLGHIGYGVVPWKRRRGYATRAVRMILPEARRRGWRYVEITTDEDNIASRRVMEAAGGYLYERFAMPDSHGGGPGRRYRIPLDDIPLTDVDPTTEPN